LARIEFESLHELSLYLKISKDLTGAIFQNLDLTGQSAHLAGATLRDNLMLGCTLNAEILELLDDPLVFPAMPSLPFNPFRATLYTPEELLGDYVPGNFDTYDNTVDGATYRQYKEEGKDDNTDVRITLARRLHDHAISDALQEYLVGKQVVAIMGGHSMGRDAPMYLEVARLSRQLVHEGFLPASGGGPGAMEATHLGAWFAERSDTELLDAVRILSKAPMYNPQDEWLDAAFEVAEKFPVTSRSRCDSLGIPTWLYGHEPPSCFALHIAKYFANSVREDGLLSIARHGVVFSPGSAGTIQEIFQDATQNHYETHGHASPMIFFGTDYWSTEKPVFPLLKALARGKNYERYLSITDERDEMVEGLKSFRTVLGKNAE
jgi:predicted Rossmann-fold nucleotide-binding protein